MHQAPCWCSMDPPGNLIDLHKRLLALMKKMHETTPHIKHYTYLGIQTQPDVCIYIYTTDVELNPPPK